MADSQIHNIKQIEEGLFHLILDDKKSCHFCGEYVHELIKKHPIPINSRLILETVPEYCSIACAEVFLSSTKHFKSIAYILTKETNRYNPWIHAFIVRNHNKNTHFFNNYDDAYNWSMLRL